MYSHLNGRRLAILSGISVICLSTFSSRSPAAEPQASPHDFSAEAENARANPLEPLRDPEIRRWMLDRLDEKRFEQVTPINDARSIWAPTDQAPIPAELPPEVRRIQESLGGPAVNQFPSLRWDEATSQRPQDRGGAATQQRLVAVSALREAAALLDTTANRLEQLELYSQADGLRQQAQQLRIDARGMTGATPAAGASTQSTPAVWLDGQPAEPAIMNTAPRPQLEPVPQPENPSDPPKPQPLLDSPEATPQPDVEVEG